MTTLEDTKQKVLEFFNSPDKWTQKDFARDKQGNLAYYNAKNATCWCLEGGLLKLEADFDITENQYEEFADNFKDRYGMHIVRYNDSHSYNEVMKAVREL